MTELKNKIRLCLRKIDPNLEKVKFLLKIKTECCGKD